MRKNLTASPAHRKLVMLGRNSPKALTYMVALIDEWAQEGEPENDLSAVGLFLALTDVDRCLALVLADEVSHSSLYRTSWFAGSYVLKCYLEA